MAAEVDKDRPLKLKIAEQYTRESFEESLNRSLVNGDVWYLVDCKWFKECKKYLGFLDSTSKEEVNEESRPGPIDNSNLFDPLDPSELRSHMIDEMDYSLVPKDIWDSLVDEFGLVEGQSPISRIVREFGMFVKHTKVEIYFTEILLTLESQPDKVVKKKFSKADKLEKIVDEMRKVFEIEADKEVRFWNKYTANTYELVENLDSTVQETGLFANQTVLLEVQNEDGTWPRTQRRKKTEEENEINSRIPSPPPPSTNGEKKESSPSMPFVSVTADGLKYVSASSAATLAAGAGSSSKLSGYQLDGGQVEDGRPGICGLSNLGNTCFMNSILQGLSNTPAIAEYFENDNYEEDINEDNPLGMKGEIARAFGQLIKDMWSGRYSHVVPRNFKMVVGRFAPQFSGYQQQDSQELLTFLLDGLHEDLNRVKKKPYVEMSDSQDREDEEIAKEAWENYKRRNDSVILDIFHGLLKSTLVCPQCNKISVTFDPMCYLSLPLPVKKDRLIEVFYVSMSPTEAPVQYKVMVPKTGTISDLTKELGRMVGVPQNRLVVTDVYSHRFHVIYIPGDQISKILEKDDIFVYEVSDPEDSNQVVVPVYLRSKKPSRGIYSPTVLFGQPFLLSVPTVITEEGLYTLLQDRMSRYVTRPAPDDEWWKPAPKDVERMEVAGDSPSEGVELPAPSPAAGSAAQSPASEESPTSELSNGHNIQDEDMASDDEGEPSNRIFTFSLVNSYGNEQICESICQEDGVIRLQPKSYLALNWTPKAVSLFFNEKAAEDFRQDESIHPSAAPKKQSVNLTECLKLYTSQEKLGADDAWYCPQCKEHQQATKKFDLWMLPEVLIISLKRFSYNRYWRDKIDVQVDFPVEGLDMTPFVIAPGHGQAVYDLIAVSNHYGGMGGGHYTAFAKNRLDEKWYYFDDSSVTESKKDVVSKAAYVLFYQRRSTNTAAVYRDIPAAAGSAAALNNGTNGVSSSDEDMEVN